MGTVNDIPEYNGETLSTLAEKMILLMKLNDFRGLSCIVVSDDGYVNMYVQDKDNKVTKHWQRMNPDSEWEFTETKHEED